MKGVGPYKSIVGLEIGELHFTLPFTHIDTILHYLIDRVIRP